MTRSVALPDELLKRAEKLAAREHLPLEEFLSARLSEQFDGLEYLEQRAARTTREKFEAALRHVPDIEPEEHDRL